jgi:Fur family ferric uptake transcriptional regulator
MTDKVRRNTRQRQVVLEELRKLTSHPTAADLYQITRTRLPKISLGTVYRNLERLTETGAIQKLQMGGAEARFDGNPKPHYHVRCVYCDRVDDVHDLPDAGAVDQVKHLRGYEILGFRLDFTGICPDCRDLPPPDAGRAASLNRN